MTTTSSVAALVDDLNRRGVELRLRDGRLLFKSSGGIPDELRQRMRLNKPALIELLQQGQPTIPEIAGIRLDRMLVLDFETYHETTGRDGYSLSRLTIPEYVADARFKVHGVALRHPDGRGEFRTDVEAALRELVERWGPRLEAVTVVGHNLAFDLYILAERFGIDPLRTFDTMLASYHVHGRKDDHGGGESASLADLARRYGLGSKGELGFMAGVREADPDQLARLSEYAINDVVLTYALATKLLPQITNPAIELPLMTHTLRLFSRPRVRVDRDGLGELLRSVEAKLAEAIEAAGVTENRVGSDTLFREELARRLARSKRPLPTKKGKRGEIPATAKDDAAMQALLNDDDPAVAALCRARLAKKSADPVRARLQRMIDIANATDGRLPITLVYCGASTGRFAGGGKLNVQNLGRGGLDGRIRELIVPEPGHVFVIADYAQVEPRVLAWYAGQDDQLRAFADRRDLYCEFIAPIVGEEVRKPREDDPPELKTRLLAHRQLGKAAVLGLGYGMGADRFLATLQADPSLAGLIASGSIDPAFCRQLVDRYRETYARIPAFWRALERSARYAAMGQAWNTHRLKFERREDGEVLLYLPSGRALRYPRLRTRAASRPRARPGEIELVYGNDHLLYGGKLVENVVQATARDLLAEAILRIEQRGLGVAFHVHDEVVVMVPVDQTDEAKRIVEEEMTRVPGWATGLPIAAEVRVAGRYGK